MIKTRAPLRIGFGGGGTDVPPYCDEHGGVCLAVTIDKYAYAEYGEQNPEPSDMEKRIAKLWNSDSRLTLISGAKPTSGLGGSASLCVAGLKATPSLANESPMVLAKMAYEVERLGLGVIGGYQDQLSAAYGGLLYMQFGHWPDVRIKRLEIPRDYDNLFYLLYMGERVWPGKDVIADQVQRYNKKALDTSKQIANELALSIRDPLEFGKLMEEAWQVKKEYTPLISNTKIDDFHDWALKNGAIAVKLCGAGGGGYAAIMADPRDPEWIASAMKDKDYDCEKVKFVEKGVEIIEEEQAKAG